jgi:ABC-type molybdate transport system permease subunit
MDWITIIAVAVGAWAVLQVLAGERQNRTQQIAIAMADAAEQVKAAQKKRSVQAAVAAVAKMEAAKQVR